MSLKMGDWKMNENGAETTLAINKIDPNTGVVSGSIEGLGPFNGLWDETSRTISFSYHSPFDPAQPHREETAIYQRFYKGFLFSTPRNPAPGQDLVWTLTGFFQCTDLPTALTMGGNAKRNTFGWFAKITEVV